MERAYQRGSETVHALNQISISIARGEFAVVLGPSGSGKSTLLNLLGGIDRPTRGDVWVDGKDLNVLSEGQLDAYRRDRVGFVFQFNNLLPSLTAEENVGLPLVAQGSTWKHARTQAASLLTDLGLANRLSHLPSELSGGEQQRVALARAIIKTPSLVLADEPTGDLDSSSAEHVLELMAQLNREGAMTFIVATHNMQVAARATQIIELTNGQLSPAKSQA